MVESDGLENRYPVETGSWVRIPLSPPNNYEELKKVFAPQNAIKFLALFFICVQLLCAFTKHIIKIYSKVNCQSQ